MLRHVNRNMAVGGNIPIERLAKIVIHIAHELDVDGSIQDATLELLFNFVGRAEINNNRGRRVEGTSRGDGRRIVKPIGSLRIVIEGRLWHPCDDVCREGPPRTNDVGENVVETILGKGEKEVQRVAFRPTVHRNPEIVANDDAAGDRMVTIRATRHADDLTDTPQGIGVRLVGIQSIREADESRRVVRGGQRKRRCRPGDGAGRDAAGPKEGNNHIPLLSQIRDKITGETRPDITR